MNVKHDALEAESWAERQMGKDAGREGLVVHKQCLTCSVFLSDIKKKSDVLCHSVQTDESKSKTDGLLFRPGAEVS